MMIGGENINGKIPIKPANIALKIKVNQINLQKVFQSTRL